VAVSSGLILRSGLIPLNLLFNSFTRDTGDVKSLTTRRVWVLSAAVMVALCACSSTPPVTPPTATLTTESTTAHPHASTTPQIPPPPPPTTSTRNFARLVTAAGVTQWLQCFGTGDVTAVIVPGLGSSTSDWLTVLPQLQQITRTCIYDRPGLGHSPQRADGRDPLDAGRHATELAAALNTAGEHGPYLIIGHSYGGLIARAFIAQQSRAIAGVFLAESVTPNDPTLGDMWNEATSLIDLEASSRATQGGPPLGSRPLLVMSASRPEANRLNGPASGQSTDVTDEWNRGQRANLQLSSDSIAVTAHSGHVLQKDSPEAVVEGVRELIRAIDTGKPLTCTPVWKQWQATCRQ